jgi:CheY-like chemotaxis protein
VGLTVGDVRNEQASRSPGDHRAIDVLVVDDDDDVRASTGEIISSGGYTVAEAADGQEALRLLGEMVVGLMLLDIQMPKLDGLALLDRLDDPPPTVILSARDYQKGPRSREAKILLHLQKPTTPRELLLTVAGAIGPPRNAGGNGGV